MLFYRCVSVVTEYKRLLRADGHLAIVVVSANRAQGTRVACEWLGSQSGFPVSRGKLFAAGKMCGSCSSSCATSPRRKVVNKVECASRRRRMLSADALADRGFCILPEKVCSTFELEKLREEVNNMYILHMSAVKSCCEQNGESE